MGVEMLENDSESMEIQLLKSQIAALEQLLDVYEKSVLENTEKLYKEIAERKKAEEEINFKAQVLDSTNDSILVHD
jgi:hypothetical protein